MTSKSINRQRVIYDQRFNQKNDIYYQSYELGKQLGKGGFAQVFEVFKTNQISPNLKAAKVLSLKDKNGQNKEKIQTEIKLMQIASQDSDNFVKYYNSFTYSEKFYIIMQLCELGSLNDVFKKRKVLSEPEVRYIMQQLVEILLQLKKKGIVHRDIKPANILISSNFRLKLADFGLAILQSEINKVKTMCGTPNYLAPQVINKKGYSYEVDLWAMGVMMFTFLYGVAPFQTKQINQTYEKIKKGSFKFDGPIKPIRVSQEAKSLIKDILKTQTNQRIKLEEILVHPFFCYYQIPRKLEKEFIQTPPPAEFVRRYMKKIVMKNDRRPIQFTQNNSETRLQKKQITSTKVTYLNRLPRSIQKVQLTAEHKFIEKHVKMQQLIDLQLSKVETSTSLKKRTRNSIGPNPTPKKVFRNNDYLKNQIKIQEHQRFSKINEVNTEQPYFIQINQEKKEQKEKIEYNSTCSKVKLNINNTNLSCLFKEKRIRSLSYPIKIQQQLLIQNRIKQERKQLTKLSTVIVNWDKIMQNGNFLYNLSNQLYGILFKDNSKMITRDFSQIKYIAEKDQNSDNLDHKMKFKLDFKKSQFRQYEKKIPVKSKIKLQQLKMDEIFPYLKGFAQVDIGRFFILDKGIVQFRHNHGWIFTYKLGDMYFFHKENQQTESKSFNFINWSLIDNKVSSRFFQFMEALKGLTNLNRACNGWEVKDDQIQTLTTFNRSLQAENLRRLVL